MKKSRSEMLLIGITTRTDNSLEVDPEKGKILPVVMHYFHNDLPSKIPNRKNAGTTYCAYTDYESDHTGPYTYFIGEEVTSLDDIPDGFEALTIPAQEYFVMTSGPGQMPAVIREPWMKIWQMTDKEFGGKRSYITDFELYDERASDHDNVIVDIYIGLQT